MNPALPPTLAEAHTRIAAVDPGRYARTRNALDGAVSGLSPFITHGVVTLRDVLAGVAARHRLTVQHKFVFELGWREYFRHVWAHRGDGILHSLHDGPLPDSAYARELPADLREARTGVPVVDQAVRGLYQTGTLHNHARMWLASYTVHLRKLHWRTGADWMVAHLLDGDLASNHLSWQWVAGTGSHKPYLFNAENVGRHAPPAWHSAESAIDLSYDALDRLARDPRSTSAASPGPAAVPATPEPPTHRSPPASLACTPPDEALVRGRDVWLVHPWCLREPAGLIAAHTPADTLLLGVFIEEFHHAWPWSELRWQFVGRRMAELTAHRWHARADSLAQVLRAARSVRTFDDPHMAPWLRSPVQCVPAPALFPPVARRCDSFSQWWTRTTRPLKGVDELLDP